MEVVSFQEEEEESSERGAEKRGGEGWCCCNPERGRGCMISLPRHT
jgi:hypothetical protein